MSVASSAVPPLRIIPLLSNLLAITHDLGGQLLPFQQFSKVQYRCFIRNGIFSPSPAKRRSDVVS